MIHKTLKLSNGMDIKEGYCTCLNCNIRIKYNDVIINNDGMGNKLTITHINVYKMIIDYGISEYGKDFISIETPELIYYIYKSKGSI